MERLKETLSGNRDGNLDGWKGLETLSGNVEIWMDGKAQKLQVEIWMDGKAQRDFKWKCGWMERLKMGFVNIIKGLY